MPFAIVIVLLIVFMEDNLSLVCSEARLPEAGSSLWTWLNYPNELQTDRHDLSVARTRPLHLFVHGCRATYATPL